MSKIIGIDVDGVLARFCGAYAKILTDLTGIQYPPESDTWPSEWYWDRASGVTRDREGAAWKLIKANPTFWRDLEAYPEAEEFLITINASDHDVYFITNRMGTHVKVQTENWIINHGYEAPTVLISEDKGSIAKALKLDFYIDDKIENCQAVVSQAPTTRVTVCKRPYNTDVTGATRGTLLEFLDAIYEEEEVTHV